METYIGIQMVNIISDQGQCLLHAVTVYLLLKAAIQNHIITCLSSYFIFYERYSNSSLQA